MTYQYDIGGNRTIREQSDINNGTIADIYQDVYLGGIERRHVQLQNLAQEAISIHAAEANIGFVNVANTRELHHAGGLRLEWDNENSGDGIANNPPKIFLSFSNHLGSTSAVIDYDTGDLVEWNTHYAYGADESRWKNTDPKYDNNEDPYGFTGKEEDKAVGLHYFGARYYSSYLGRWLSPDPPVIHGGGLSNHYNYGGNSPYIFVDPDGNFIHIIVGAVVGAVVGTVTGIVKGIRSGKGLWGTVGSAVLGSIIGAASGAAIAATGGAAAGAVAGGATGAAATFTAANGLAWATAATVGGTAASVAYAAAAAGAAAAWSFTQTAITTKGDFQQAGISAAISFGSSIVGSAVGSAASGLGKFGSAAASYASSVGTSYAASALTTGVNGENWDDILLDASISSIAGIAASYTAGDAITKSAGMGVENGKKSELEDVGYTKGSGENNTVNDAPLTKQERQRIRSAFNLVKKDINRIYKLAQTNPEELKAFVDAGMTTQELAQLHENVNKVKLSFDTPSQIGGEKITPTQVRELLSGAKMANWEGVIYVDPAAAREVDYNTICNRLVHETGHGYGPKNWQSPTNFVGKHSPGHINADWIPHSGGDGAKWYGKGGLINSLKFGD